MSLKNYLVELSMRWTTEIEVEAKDEESAIEEAVDRADDEIRYEQIDWEVDYVECLDEENEEK